MDALINRLVYKIILQDGADEEEFEVYKFGLEVFLINAFNLLAAIILSLFFGNLLILFFFLFCVLPFDDILVADTMQQFLDALFQIK